MIIALLLNLIVSYNIPIDYYYEEPKKLTITIPKADKPWNKPKW